MTGFVILVVGIIFGCGVVVGWRIGYDDGKQVMRDAYGLPQRARAEK